MNTGWALLMICAVCAAIGIYRGLMNWRLEHSSTPAMLSQSTAKVRQRSTPRIHWLTPTAFHRLIESSQDVFLIHLIDESGPADHWRLTPTEVAVTLDQLGDMLPWIPRQNRIAIYSTGGIDISASRRLTAIAGGRELNLLTGAPSVSIDALHVPGGASWR